MNGGASSASSIKQLINLNGHDKVVFVKPWIFLLCKVPNPHLMFYAPNVTNEDIGAVPNSSLLYPFIFKEGIAEQSYMIQLIERQKTPRSWLTRRPFSMISAPIAIFFAFRTRSSDLLPATPPG